MHTKFFDLKLLQEMFTESSGEIGSERFDPAYFLLEHHHNTTFDDLKVNSGYFCPLVNFNGGKAQERKKKAMSMVLLRPNPNFLVSIV